jgi:hypothetical protein
VSEVKIKVPLPEQIEHKAFSIVREFIDGLSSKIAVFDPDRPKPADPSDNAPDLPRALLEQDRGLLEGQLRAQDL